MVTVKEFRIAMPMKVEEYQRAQVIWKANYRRHVFWTRRKFSQPYLVEIVIDEVK